MVTEAKPLCPKCNGKSIYHRIATNTWRCQGCGNVWPVDPQPRKA